MLNALIISVSLVVVASLLRRIRYTLEQAESELQRALVRLEEYHHDLKLLSSLTVEESGQVSFLALVPDDTVILRFNEYVIDYKSLLEFERGDSDYITVYN